MSAMDTTGFSQVGKYGTISLLKRQEPSDVITAFGIDAEELTFGRDPGCSVRLYYPDVSLVHCKLIFEERKAFLVVLGETGLLVDGCNVSPNTTTFPTTIPLANDSEIEIHNKRFRFNYPPKNMRVTLFNTPPQVKNRKLRLSMIQSAQVFSPRPSKDPRENLRILQSPLKNRFKSPVKPPHLSRPPMSVHVEPEEPEEIVLVDGDHPRVVEDERDLVILEDVEAPPPVIRVNQGPPYQLPPQTPRRKSLSKNTLHRAVLIRSAQRAVLRAEEEEEEKEVLDAVVGLVEESDEDQGTADDGTDEDEGEYEEEYEEEVREEPRERSEQKSVWRKSLERIWPFRGSDEAEQHERDDGEDNDEPNESEEDNEEDEEEDELADAPAPLPALRLQTPVRRQLGSFMTPQARAQSGTNLFSRPANQIPQPQPAGGRFSLGGGEARRVLLEQPWRVKDIVVPPTATASSSDTTTADPSPPTPRPTRPTLSEEERKAIQERRRSALREPDNFFPGGIPGMSPSKAPRQATPTSPTKSGFAYGSSPAKAGSLPRESSGNDEEIDTRSLLEKMKETVEGMKRRRSIAPSIGGGESTPRPPTTSRIPRTPAQPAMFAVPGSIKKLSFLPPPKEVSDKEDTGSQGVDDAEELSSMNKEKVFSLLRPEARADLSRRKSLAEVSEPSDTNVVNHIEVVVEDVDEDHAMVVDEEGSTEEVVEDPKKGRGRARLLRPKKATEDEAEQTKEPERSRSREPAGRQRQQRLRTPLPEESDDQEANITPALPKNATRRARKVPTEGPEEVPLPTVKRSVRKATVEPEEQAVAPAPARRGRKATVESEAPGVPKSAPKRGRKAAAETEEIEESPPMAATTTKRTGRKGATTPIDPPEASTQIPVKKGRTPKATTSEVKKRMAAASKAEVEEDQEDDPLDTIEDKEEQPQRIAAKTRGRKKAPVKEESVEDAEVLLPPPPKTGRAKAAATTLKTPATTKSRTSKKTPSTAPAAVEGVDKENTPRSGSGSATNSPPESDDAVVKVKVSRPKAVKTSRAAKVAVKEEAVEEPSRTTTRVMRTRTRTKTG